MTIKLLSVSQEVTTHMHSLLAAKPNDGEKKLKKNQVGMLIWIYHRGPLYYEQITKAHHNGASPFTKPQIKMFNQSIKTHFD